MYKNILIATDGSELAEKAVAQGLALAKALAARATVVTVTEPGIAYVTPDAGVAFPIEDYEAAATEAAKKALDSATAIARQVGVACDTVHVKDKFPADGIVAEAEKRRADLIVMASHGRRGVSRILLGSQANKIVTHSKVPVLICR